MIFADSTLRGIVNYVYVHVIKHTLVIETYMRFEVFTATKIRNVYVMDCDTV
jgi:hypothetical protein